MFTLRNKCLKKNKTLNPGLANPKLKGQPRPPPKESVGGLRFHDKIRRSRLTEQNLISSHAFCLPLPAAAAAAADPWPAANADS